jgi:hypothetical protein
LQECGGDLNHPDYEALLSRVMFKDYLCVVKAKLELVKEENRLKITVVKLRPLEGDQQVKECRALIDAIKKYAK